MKQKIKLLLLLLSFCITLITISCQVEEDIINSEVPQPKLILRKLSKKEFENNKLIKEKLNCFKSSENLNGRIVHDSILNFYVNTDNVIFADNGNVQTYTFPITRINKSFVSENLIIQVNKQQINTYIFDYQEDINNLKNLSHEQMEQKEILKYRILDSNISNNILSRDEYDPVEEMVICFDTFVWDVVEFHEGDNVGGTEINEWGWVYQGTHCDYASNQAGGSGSSTESGVFGSSGGGGGSSSSTDNTIITVPSTISGVDNECISPRGDLDNNCVLDENEANFVTFLDNLTTQERQLIIGNNNTKMNVFNYLVDQNWSDESEQFAQELIDYLINNPSMTWEIVMNNRTSFDTNEGEVDNYTSGGYDTTTYPTFNPQQQTWPSILPVIPQNQFVGWNRRLHPNWHCMDYSKEQLRVMGYQISSYYSTGQTFQIYTAQNGVNSTALSQGLSYLKYALSNGIPVIVGIDDAPGHTGNLDNTTDHFIVIVGMGTDSNGKYFQFYDNATGAISNGTSPLNKLYYNSSTGLISGTSQAVPYSTGLTYTITMIRKSKPL